MSYDQFWSLFCVPIGLLVCFGPVIVGWLIAELRNPTDRIDPPGR
jgi:hypothetical protein